MTGRLTILFERYDLTPRNHATINRNMLRERGEFHGKKRVQRHFNRNQWTAPGGPYRYSKRSQRTINRKKKKGVDPYRPNVMTGDLYRLIQSNGNVTATQYRWSWRASGNKKRPLPDWQRREIEAIAPDEVEDDISFFEKRYAEMAERPEFRRQRSRRITG